MRIRVRVRWAGCINFFCLVLVFFGGRGVVSGCIGLLTKLSGSSLPPTGLSHLQAAGLLFSLCEKLTQFPKSDAIAAKRKVLRVSPPEV